MAERFNLGLLLIIPSLNLNATLFFVVFPSMLLLAVLKLKYLLEVGFQKLLVVI